MYALFDKQAKCHLNPLHFINHGEAVRWLTTIVNNAEEKQSNVTLYPHQFVLIHVFNYDDQNGKTENINEEIMEASAVKETVPRYTIKQLLDQLDERYGQLNPEVQANAK